MDELKVKVNLVNDSELTEEQKKQTEEKKKKQQPEEQERIRKEAKKARRPSPGRMADEICRLAKKTTEAEDPKEALIARAILGVFLRELLEHKLGKHVEVAKRLQSEMKEKMPLHLRQEGALALANAAIRYEIAFGRVKEISPGFP